MDRVNHAVLRVAEGVNEVIGHPLAFVVALVQTLIWTVAVLATHFDQHGFWFLYTATAVSYVTQFTLTLVGLSAKREAARASSDVQLALTAIHAALAGIQVIVQTVKLDLEEHHDLVEEHLGDQPAE